MNRQPWHFIVVRDRNALRRLGELASSGPYIAEAPLAIVVAIDKTRFAVSDARRAIQSMLLTAWADGMGSNWVRFGGLDNVKALLDIPDKFEVLAILPFGYPSGAWAVEGSSAKRSLTWHTWTDSDGRSSELLLTCAPPLSSAPRTICRA